MIIAFVPLRGGSKSIPNKNIKPLYGKPLAYWSLSALSNSKYIDKVVVATDSQEIKNTITSFQLSKIEMYDRLPQNAEDHSSTESVMLEYLTAKKIDSQDTFILVQATSPFTTAEDFDNAIIQYQQNNADSLFSAVRSKRFYWNTNGSSINYDFTNRPRRQDFDGVMLENGSFYINKVLNIITNKNRLSGQIDIYEMPEYTALELDEPDDWEYAEFLIKKHLKPRAIKNKIRLFLTDVDGTLTDAGMYYANSGEELKKFNTHDGKGLELLKSIGIKTGIITSEATTIVKNRAQKLKVDYLFQGAAHGGKLEIAKQLCTELNIGLNEVAYIGDDINCRELLESVGVAGCPANSLPIIKQIPNIIQTTLKGGEGAVREFIEIILKSQNEKND
ncbi:MAG TPA: hypothetical protein PLP75_12395 [Burkholderiales bacterium]|nr:hypothetical protein [Burkholderiales bacterium]